MILYIIAIVACMSLAPTHAAEPETLEERRITSVCSPFHPHFQPATRESLGFLKLGSWENDNFIRFQKLVHSFIKPIESSTSLIPLFAKWAYVLSRGLSEFDQTIEDFSQKVQGIYMLGKYELVWTLTEFMEKTEQSLQEGKLSATQFNATLEWLFNKAIQALVDPRAPIRVKKQTLSTLLTQLEAAQWFPKGIEVPADSSSADL